MLRIKDKNGVVACTVSRADACIMWPPLAVILATAPDCEELQLRTADMHTLQTMQLFYRDFRDELVRLDKPQAEVQTELHALATAHLSSSGGNLVVFTRFMQLTDRERLRLGQLAGCVGNQPFANLFAAYFMTLAARSLTEGMGPYLPLLSAQESAV